MIDDTYSISRLSKNNLSDIGRLHQRVYGKSLSGYFEKKYNTAFTNTEYIGYLAYDKQQFPIAFYGVIPCFLSFGGELVLSAQSADTMTHPQYRNKGLFVELANLTCQLCKETGIRLVFGFPNQNSLPGFVGKLGWQDTGVMDCFEIPLSTLPLERISAKFPFLKKAYQAYTNLILQKRLTTFAEPASSVLDNDFDGVWRGDSYLEYKKYNNTTIIAAGNAAAWIKINNGLIIGDLFNVDASNFTETMKLLIKLARILGLSRVMFYSSRGMPLYTLFSAHYRFSPTFPVIFKNISFNKPIDNVKFTFADIDIF